MKLKLGESNASHRQSQDRTQNEMANSSDYTSQPTTDSKEKKIKLIGLLATIIMLFSIVEGLIYAEFLSRLVSDVTTSNLEGAFRHALIIFAFTITSKAIEILVNTEFEKKKAICLHLNKMEWYRHFLGCSLQQLFRSNHGETIEKLNDDFDTVLGKSISLIPSLLTNAIKIVVYSLVISIRNPWIAMILLTMSFIQIISPLIVDKLMQENYDESRDAEAELTNRIIEGYRGFAEIKLFGLKEWWLERFRESQKENLRVGRIGIFTSTKEDMMNTFFSDLLKYGTYAIVGLFILLNKSDLDTGIRAIALSGGLYASVQAVFSLIPRFHVSQIAQKRVAEWWKDNNSQIGNRPDSFDIVCEEATFGYDAILLDQVNIRLNEDGVYLLKGSNGSGKTTLLRGMAGMIPCMKGAVRIGDEEIQTIDNGCYPTDIFYLSQEDPDFGFTPKEFYQQILGNEYMNAEGCAEKFGLTRQQMTDISIKDLSGGERKKVYIALAMVLNSKVLLMDEPTNSLDAQSKEKLVQMLRDRNGTTVIITHDDVFDYIADDIYQIKEGVIQHEKN